VRRQIVIGFALAIVVAAGCSSGNSDDDVPFTTETKAIEIPPTPTATPTGAENLTLTDQVRRQLIHAKALEAGVPDSAYLRLYRGSAYYGLDLNTGIYWAAASVVPSRDSVRAQVWTQDEGAYNIFVMRPGGDWKIYDAGRDGPEARSGTQCPIKVPAAVLRAWHWAPNTCDPPL
jgi:hypothetical protein